jgi:hypothetical protein
MFAHSATGLPPGPFQVARMDLRIVALTYSSLARLFKNIRSILVLALFFSALVH